MNDGPQRTMAPRDVPPPTDLPAYWKSRLEDIEAELQAVSRGEVTTIATSPGGRPVFAVSYGEREDFHSRANYNSAVAAGNPAYYARKAESTKPVILLVGPVHGQEVEGIVGAVNLVHILETGADHRGSDWSHLRDAIDRFRFIIVPCGNPDGRARCPYDSFVGVPHLVMTKHGQGTHRDGTLWGWPGAKANHPMRGDVGILGCYYNDDGINMVHDDFFAPMAAETAAILDLARREAPDTVLFLHSNEDPPFVVQTGSVPLLMRRRTREFAQRLKRRLMQESLSHGPIHRLRNDDGSRLPGRYFNLDSAAHHVCGATSFAFECIHGVLRPGEEKPPATHEQILDIQLCLYDELVSYTLERRICWE